MERPACYNYFLPPPTPFSSTQHYSTIFSLRFFFSSLSHKLAWHVPLLVWITISLSPSELLMVWWAVAVRHSSAEQMNLKKQKKKTYTQRIVVVGVLLLLLLLVSSVLKKKYGLVKRGEHQLRELRRQWRDGFYLSHPPNSQTNGRPSTWERSWSDRQTEQSSRRKRERENERGQVFASWLSQSIRSLRHLTHYAVSPVTNRDP